MGDEGRERDLPNTDLVSMMIEAWPSAVPWEDNYGTSALEYAILSGAPIEVVRLLQAVTCHQTKKQAQQVRSTNIRRVSQDSNDCQQQHRPAIVSEPLEQEPNTAFDGAASTMTSNIFPQEGEEASFCEMVLGMCHERQFVVWKYIVLMG